MGAQAVVGEEKPVDQGKLKLLRGGRRRMKGYKLLKKAFLQSCPVLFGYFWCWFWCSPRGRGRGRGRGR
jgi:hypothetical protein